MAKPNIIFTRSGTVADQASFDAGDSPLGRAVQSTGSVMAIPFLDGLQTATPGWLNWHSELGLIAGSAAAV
jgi:hypothetical protein